MPSREVAEGIQSSALLIPRASTRRILTLTPGSTVLYSFMRYSEVQPGEKTQEKLRKIKCVTLTGPRERRHATPRRTTRKNTSTVRRQKTGGREHLGHGCYWGVLGKGDARQGETA